MEFNDLSSQYKVLEKKIRVAMDDVFSSCNFIMGKQVQEFEERLADYLKVKHVISCSDGTAALQLIGMAYNISHHDAIFCPAMTFIASVEPFCLMGATPVLCDINRKSYNIDIGSLERQIENVLKEGKLVPKAIIAVDFLGNPANHVEIERIAQKYGMFVIEDAAQGMGGIYNGMKCGSFGSSAATSFFPSKPLGCYGDGGAVMTNDDSIAEKINSLKIHGKGKDKYHNIHIGMNSRLDTLQAAILLAKMSIFEKEVIIRQEVALRYTKALEGKFQTPYIAEGDRSAYAQYILMASSEEERKKIQSKLLEYEIPTILYYPTPLHELPVFQELNGYGEQFINAEKYSRRAFGIPFSPYLTKQQQDKVINILLK